MIDNNLMTEVVFGFNNKEVSVVMKKQDAKELFHDITGVSILNIDENDDNNNQSNFERIIHPTLEELTEFFRKNINIEIGSDLIRDTFYSNYTRQWRKILVNIYGKIQKALRIVEVSENGKYKKIREGKYIKYKFIPIKINTLENYGIY